MDIRALTVELYQAVEGYVKTAFDEAARRVDELATQLKAIPAGPRGELGPQGASGLDGSQGLQGIPGERGADGAQGPVGEKGDGGSAGDPGERGQDGAPGPQGTAGERGVDGAPGERGPAGESIQGDPGSAGADGKDGMPGRDGVNGLSAFQLAVETGYQGNLFDWVLSLRGSDGLPGKDAVARDGRDGREGKDGEPGRDAAMIEPLPAIDAARSYPRGTWAKHERGLWLARAPTDGMTGWDCVVAGVMAVEVAQEENERQFSVKAVLSDGTTAVQSFILPTLIYREVWSVGEYERGDVCTWGGSAWHCQERTTDKPGTSAAWKMMVKEGRPGKDGVAPSPPGPRQPVSLK